MEHWPGPPYAYAPLLKMERARLLELLDSLGPQDWDRPTACPGWTVLGLAAHLVGVDLGYVAWQRDDHHGTPAPGGLDTAGFVAWLDVLQSEWVHAAKRLSPRLVLDLLRWLDDQVADTVAAQVPTQVSARVSWASDDAVPLWLDHARELSERWIHRQQLLHATGAPSDLRADLAAPVLDALRHAYPHGLYALRRPVGSTITVTLTGPEVVRRWDLVSTGEAWRFADPLTPPIAELRLTTDQAWRLLSNNTARRDWPAAIGDPNAADALLRTRAIIGVPK